MRRSYAIAALAAVMLGSFMSAASAVMVTRDTAAGCVYFIDIADNSDESQGIIRSSSKDPDGAHRAFTNVLTFGDFQRETNWATWSLVTGFDVPAIPGFIIDANIVLHERLSRGLNPLVSPGGFCSGPPCLVIDTAAQFGPEVRLTKDDLTAAATFTDAGNGEPWAKMRPDGVRRYYIPVDQTKILYNSRTMIRMRNFGRDQWDLNGVRDLVRFYDWGTTIPDFMPRLEITTAGSCPAV